MTLGVAYIVPKLGCFVTEIALQNFFPFDYQIHFLYNAAYNTIIAKQVWQGWE